MIRRFAKANGVSVKAYSGTTGILVASNVAPIQKFRWSDYSVYADTGYAYTVHPVYKNASVATVTAANRRLFLQEGPRVEVSTQGFDGEDAIIFNRAVASSQAFARRFPDLDADIQAVKGAGTLAGMSLPNKALTWLSRGLVEQMQDFLEQAAIENEHLLHHPDIPGAQLFPRVTTALMHNKFVILSKVDVNGERSPQAVLARSTNWTENGCYRQTNVVHISRAKGQYQGSYKDHRH